MYQSPLDHLADHSCTLCPLHEDTERVCVMGSGNPESRVMILGEAPGGNEERTGRVFSGAAGGVLDNALESAGISRRDVYVSNAIKCRPEDNARPERAHWEACRVYLEREVEAVRPTHTLLLGNTALQAVARRSGITKQRGRRLQVKDALWDGCTVMATIHPAYVLRNPGQHGVFLEDVRRFARAIKGQFRAVRVRPKGVNTVAGLRRVRRALDAGTVCAYDVECAFSPWDDDWHLVCLGLTIDGEEVFVIPLDHPESPFRKRWRDVLRYLKPSLERSTLKLVAQNGKFDNVQLAGGGIFLRHTFDIMLAAHLLDENRPKSLGFLSQTILGADEYKGMAGDLSKGQAYKVPIKPLMAYNGYDTGYTHQIYPKLRAELLEQPRLTRIFAKLMMPASHMIQEVEARGFYVSLPRLERRMVQLQAYIDEELTTLREYVPEAQRDTINFNSTQQLGAWLFSSPKKGGLGFNPLETTATGRPSTREGVLLHYRDHPAIRALLRYRTLQLKWMNTYLLPWSLRLDSRSRLHTFYKLFGTVTGRLSGDMQQVPRDSFIRSVIGAPKGWRFIQADYSQVELRIIAHVAQERRMMRAYALGEDLHMQTAMSLTGKSAEDVTKEERKMAKAVNFGFDYGMYPKKFQIYAFDNYNLKVSIGEAELYRKQYFETYPDLLKWHDRQRRLVHANQQVQSPIGRIRHLPDVLSGDRAVVMEAERQAINSPVQSMASDMMLFAMVQLWPQLNPQHCFMVGTLHDGIFFECKEEYVDEYQPLIKEVMETLPLKRTFGTELTVPIVADVENEQYWTGTPDASGLGIS
jgi:uracil-DNA glycosylase family 4